MKRSNKPLKALNLPVIANINPRSVYNKVKEFHAFVEEEEIDVVFMSESWEREDKTLNAIIELQDHEIISNVYQRKGQGGRPALIVNRKKFDILNLTNTTINIKHQTSNGELKLFGASLPQRMLHPAVESKELPVLVFIASQAQNTKVTCKTILQKLTISSVQNIKEAFIL